LSLVAFVVQLQPRRTPLCSKEIKGWQNNPPVYPWDGLGVRKKEKKKKDLLHVAKIFIQMCGAVGQVAPACLADNTVALLKGLMLLLLLQ